MNIVDIIEDLAIGRIDWRKDSHMSQVKDWLNLLLVLDSNNDAMLFFLTIESPREC